MLDSETKRKIDEARDILVGKLPDPKSQVEQITIALIYKFMDDMDKQSIELGGKAKFFSGKYRKYSWSKIFDPAISGYDLVKLYGEAIQEMNHNSNIPQLFRDIFKNAFLPYKDPETLKSFLKVIDWFEYSHSEKLGDAFEYLLSIMGSQGDAGQFRTPRHIIDFIVEVVDPSKDDTNLDPACGTAGFLISAYKHILKKNTKNGKLTLTSDERKRLVDNFTGYDISPDMVRLSLVNLYLHGFKDPKIYEYDTLTSEEKWNDFYDIIMANPPFMTPKGGIKPHNRFSIQAKRSEVLFVDYIIEHLTPKGKSGVIVPEGIIFQSGTAYKSLRKMLVEENLYAIVSLPAGVFNPYSGVKTSILLMDKKLSKKTDKILFIKISNDGFDLGAQRREIKGDELPLALEIIQKYQKDNLYGKNLELDTKQQIAHLVEKTKIAENGDYNLSGDSYKEDVVYGGKWDLVEFTKVCTLEYGKSLPARERKGGEYPVMGSNGISGYHNKYLVEGPAIIVGRKGSAGEVVWQEKNCFPIDTTYYVKLVNLETTSLKFLYHILKTFKLQELKNGAGIPGLNRNDVYAKFKIPLPPLEFQNQIVSELESYQKIIDGAKNVVNNYKPSFKIEKDWDIVELGDVSEITSSKRIFQNEYVNIGIPFYRTKEIVELNEGNPISLELFISKKRYEEIRVKFDVPKKGEILLSAVGTIGISWVISDNRKFYFKDGNILWLKNLKKLDPNFLKMSLDHIFNYKINELVFGAAYKALTIIKLKKVKISLPPIEIQKQIVSKIGEEQILVESNKKLIEIFEKKIKDKIAEIWAEDGSL